LATRLLARGHSVVAITSIPGSPEVNGIRVHRLSVPRIPFADVAALPVAGDIKRILTAERIEVVHSHVSIVAPVALGGAVAAERLGLPSVLTFHSFVPGTPVLAGVTGFALNAVKWRAEMTAVSRRVAREVEGFAPNAPFSLLPNAIDTAFWTPLAELPEDGTVRLVYAGRLQAKKRPLLLLSVLRELVRTASAQNWTLTVVGEGPLGPALREGIRKLGLEDRVHFAGWVDRNSLREILRASSVFLSTAARESFGLAALEARACGVPVVAVEDSAVSDFITHEVSGLLAQTDDGFSSAAARLVRDPELRARIAAFNRRTPVPYDWTGAIEAHESVYAKAEARLRP
jgi:glycosyltransferase involved in cell wall biosynthesis